MNIKKFLKQLSIITIAAIAGFLITEQLNISSIMRLIILFGIYLVVAIIFEIIAKLFEKKQNNG